MEAGYAALPQAGEARQVVTGNDFQCHVLVAAGRYVPLELLAVLDRVAPFHGILVQGYVVAVEQKLKHVLLRAHTAERRSSQARLPRYFRAGGYQAPNGVQNLPANEHVALVHQLTLKQALLHQNAPRGESSRVDLQYSGRAGLPAIADAAFQNSPLAALLVMDDPQ